MKSKVDLSSTGYFAMKSVVDVALSVWPCLAKVTKAATLLISYPTLSKPGVESPDPRVPVNVVK